MANSKMDNTRGASYSEVLQGTVKLDSKPIFLKETDLFGNRKPSKEEWLTNIEIYKTLSATVPVEDILGIQRVGTLWRLYIENVNNRVPLLSNGVSLRGVNIPIYEKNPYVPDRSDQVRVRVKNIPLSADDSIIVKTLKDYGCELVDNPSREKLRVDGKLTNCETGDRIVFVKPLKAPLPKEMRMGFFRATVIHAGQIVKSLNQSCGKCLQDGHRTYECLNDWVCKNCKQSGHKSGDCTVALQDSHESQEPAHRDQPPRPEPQVGASEAGRTPVSATPSVSKRKKKKSKVKSKQGNTKPIQSFFQQTNKQSEQQQKQKPSISRSPPTPVDILQAQKKSKLHESSDDSSDGDDNGGSYDDSSGTESQMSQETIT